ncbi:hypothetical protein [[Mycobacterium] crassicus]|uniref:Uncharacterized protein n=1 Tax=[Mycobacterium] crassicus TaxID=2872309 RepID=A0ABU5XG72_9MYCO|nr:hypothetical protein [Mycolicibacter sp. MYC098]MEB3021285.1 hypothetical protein [Mycolicibacter sp. MYC098]
MTREQLIERIMFAVDGYRFGEWPLNEAGARIMRLIEQHPEAAVGTADDISWEPETAEQAETPESTGGEPERFVAEWTPPWPADATPGERGGIASCRAQDAVVKVCEICGRKGTRRYVETETGWRCAPTATKCPGNREPGPAPAAAPSDPPAPAPPAPKITAKPRPGITAICTGCPRTWTLTGRVLRMAVDTHEVKTGHVVDITEQEAS